MFLFIKLFAWFSQLRVVFDLMAFVHSCAIIGDDWCKCMYSTVNRRLWEDHFVCSWWSLLKQWAADRQCRHSDGQGRRGIPPEAIRSRKPFQPFRSYVPECPSCRVYAHGTMHTLMDCCCPVVLCMEAEDKATLWETGPGLFVEQRILSGLSRGCALY